MNRTLGYGEDALILWALRHKINDILKEFRDETTPSDCLIFYRPSFGRQGKRGGSVFGDFDAIIVSSENVYLTER